MTVNIESKPTGVVKPGKNRKLTVQSEERCKKHESSEMKKICKKKSILYLEQKVLKIEETLQRKEFKRCTSVKNKDKKKTICQFV